MDVEKRMRLAGAIAGIAAIVFALPHFWFWFGVTLAFPGAFPTTPPGDIYWIVGGSAILFGIYTIVYTRSSLVRRLPELIIAIPAWIGAVGFTLWGLAFFNVQIQLALFGPQAAPQFAARNADPNAVWGYYWYSLFIIWGASLGIAAYHSYRSRGDRKRATAGGQEGTATMASINHR